MADAGPAAAKLVAFVNRGSGGNEGARVLELLARILGEARVFDIKKDGGPEKGLAAECGDPAEEVRCLVAGGDGTFSWVANAVQERELTHVRLGVIPLGSGNDMSRALGWGKKFPGFDQLGACVDWARRASPHSMDVWCLDAKDVAGPAASTDADGVDHGARPLMCNYLSLGADAHVELRFNQRRWDAPEKYTSRIGNFKAHMVVGLKYVVREKKIYVADHVESLVVDGKAVALPARLQALIFCNIPSYGAGTQPWGVPKKTSKRNRALVNDCSFEVIGLRSLHQYNRMKATSSLLSHGVRITQGSSMELTLKAPKTPFQVDGEPWEQHGGVVSMTAGHPVGVLSGPSHSAGSRKNAQFDAAADAQIAMTPDQRAQSMAADVDAAYRSRPPAVNTNTVPVEVITETRPPASFG